MLRITLEKIYKDIDKLDFKDIEILNSYLQKRIELRESKGKINSQKIIQKLKLLQGCLKNNYKNGKEIKEDITLLWSRRYVSY
jgi:hypothetical protein